MRDLDEWGRRDVRLQTDGEPALLALQQAIAEARKGDTVLRNSPYNPQSNGEAEKAVQDVTDLMRRMLLGLEAKLSWAPRHDVAVGEVAVGTRRAVWAARTSRPASTTIVNTPSRVEPASTT